MLRAAHFAELQAFVAIAEERSFRRAAARLGLTRSTLSHALRSLEDRLGVQLVARTTRTVSPTPAGAALVAQLGPALAGLDDALEALNAFRESPVGSVRISVPRVAASQIIAPRLGMFAARYPGITLEVIVDDRFVDLVRDDFDAGVRLGMSLEREMAAVRLTSDQRGAVVGSPEYFARHPAPLTPRDLHAHRCINRRVIGTGALLKWPFAKGDDRLEVGVDGPIVLDADDLMLEAALGSAGLALVSEVQAAPHVAAGRLVRVLEDWCPPIYGFFLYHPRTSRPSVAVSALLDVLTSPVEPGGLGDSERRSALTRTDAAQQS